MCDIIVGHLRGNKLRTWEIFYSAKMVGVKMGQDHIANLITVKIETRQLLDDGKSRVDAQRCRPAVEAKRRPKGDVEHARRIAGVEQQPAVQGMLQQRHGRMAMN